MMTANSEDDLNLDGKHQSSFADLNYNSSGSDFTRGAAAPEIYRSLFTRRREMEEEEEEEEGWEEPQQASAYFSKHFNNHPCSPGSGGRRNTTDRNFNSIGLGFRGKRERFRATETIANDDSTATPTMVGENYDDLKTKRKIRNFS